MTELLDEASFTPAHRRVFVLSSMGILLDGFDFFIMGVALPLIVQQWSPSTLETGLVSSAAIIGAIIGASTLGALTDRIGRKLAFKLDLGMFVVFALASALAPGIWWLIAFRFLLGIGVGADYPISSSYVAEIAPSRIRSRLLVGAFSFQAVGQLLGVLVGLVILHLYPELDAWRLMLGFGVIPAAIIVILRRRVPESPQWLADQGRYDEAATVLEQFCEKPVDPAMLAAGATAEPARRWRDLFAPVLRARTVLCSGPWFLMDIATYGIGVFTPTIIAAVVIGSSASTDNAFIADDITSTEGAAFVDVFLVVGFALAILLINRVGKIRLQTTGFIMMTLSLLMLALATRGGGADNANIIVVFIGFAVFNIFMNMGPNATTFAMPAEVYPTRSRAAGAGFAAAAGKTGAAVGTLLFPILQGSIGLSWTLAIIAAGCAIAAVVTISLRRVATGLPTISPAS